MPLLPLHAGPLQMAFDPGTGFLRHVRTGNREAIRGIFGAVRDRNWGTVEPAIEDLRIDERGGGFDLSFTAVCRDAESDFVWRGEIRGTPEGRVTFVFDGEARRAFLKNRVGLCVLHPGEACAGQPCRVEHIDGRVSISAFPRFISPHQPFTSIRTIVHPVAPGLEMQVSFEGEVFEMEDQRNWTDASFKTYSTPLDLPFPVRLEAGARVRQSVTLRLTGGLDAAVSVPPAAEPRLHVDWAARRPFASVGIGLRTDGRRTPAGVTGALARLRPSHLRVDLDLTGAEWPRHFDEACRVAGQTGSHVHAAVFLDDEPDQALERLRARVVAASCPVALWLVFHTGEKVTGTRALEAARQALAGTGVVVPFASGTNAYFAELNRRRPPADSPALPCFSISPQVHAFDDLSLVETLGAQRSTLDTAQQFSASPVVVSPITLRPRFNPNATDPSAPREPEADARQPTAFAAAWTVGALARLTPHPALHSVTFYETHGPRGVMDDEGRPYPMFHVFDALRGFDAVGDVRPDDPLASDALALTGPGGRQRLVVAAFGAAEHTVTIAGVSGSWRISLPGDRGVGDGAIAESAQGQLRVDLPAAGVLLLDRTDADAREDERAGRP
jgi:D-apionolactonase